MIIENLKSNGCKNIYTSQEFKWQGFFWGGWGLVIFAYMERVYKMNE